MKATYITPNIKVVAFMVENGFYGSVINGTDNNSLMFFHPEFDDLGGSYFRNEQFNYNDDQDYNFFGD